MAYAELKPCHTQVGSGSLPVDMLPSTCIAITPLIKGKGEGAALKKIELAFRSLPIPVIGRISDGAFCLDFRCLEESQAGELSAQLGRLKF